MTLRRTLLFAAAGLCLAVGTMHAQEQPPAGEVVIDSVVVEGLHRVSLDAVLTNAAIPVGEVVRWRDVQRAIQRLYALHQFRDVRIEQGRANGKEVLRILVQEQPILTGWSVTGTEEVSARRVRGKVSLLSGRPFDPAAAARSEAAIDSLYRDQGYYRTEISLREVPQDSGDIRVVFEIDEGDHVTVSQVIVDGNEQYGDKAIVGAMSTKPEGFWWWRRGEYSEDNLELDVRDRIPSFYGERGYIDFQVLDDTLLVDEESGKAALRLRVREGDQYQVGSFEILGNRYFSSEALERYYPFGVRSSGFLGLGGAQAGPAVFDQAEWDDATQELRTLYSNNGYIYARILNPAERRTTEDGDHVVDLRWQIQEGQPAVVNKVRIRGNTVTHEDVIRRAILIVPGDVLRQDLLIRSYQNISNLGFFEQPLPFPDVPQVNQQGDVDVVFNVQERHTGNVNFGASIGQGTGVGGFIGLTEPNLFGRGKTADVQWQFGRNISNFSITYTDPALRGTLMSGSVSLHSSRLRYTVADLGRIFSRGASVQLGFPVQGSRYTRLLVSYAIEQSDYDSPTLSSVYYCQNCVLSMASVSLVRDTRIELPFPTGGALHRLTVAQGGGPLGGSGNFRRGTFEGRWYATLARLGASEIPGSGMGLVLGLSTESGFIWGDAGPHFRQLFSMGGTQFGVPLRGYEEFSVTPQGFDPQAQGQRASTVGAFGGAYFKMSGELGLRVSQAVYLSTFYDAGNVWEHPQQFNPTQLFRGAGMGVSLITPLGPIGLDYAYGFDKVDLSGNPNPSWKFHFKLGQFF